MSSNSPSSYRREGGEAFCPGKDPDELCPYPKEENAQNGFGMHRECWFEGWMDAKNDYEWSEQYTSCPACGHIFCAGE